MMSSKVQAMTSVSRGVSACDGTAVVAITAATTQANSFLTLGLPVCRPLRSEEHTSELQSLMRISYAVFCLKKKNRKHNTCKICDTITTNHVCTTINPTRICCT